MSSVEYPASFGARLRKIRLERNLTQLELADAAGMQPSAITHFEAARRKPGYDSILGLARALDVSIDMLLGVSSQRTTFRNEQLLSTKERKDVQRLIDLITLKK